MERLRTALVQIDVTVGALAANARKIALWAHRAAAEGASLIVFPELVLCGYPPEDLVLKTHFIEDCEVRLSGLAATLPKDAVVVVGAPLRAESGVHNAAAICTGGKRVGTYGKMLLPNYGVFDEKRVFAPGSRPLVLNIDGARVAIHICEDSWFADEGPCALLGGAHPDALVNISASPFHRGKVIERHEALQRTARSIRTHVLYCNLVGGQDELVFDGTSKVLDPSGDVIARSKQFEEELLLVDLPLSAMKAADASCPAVDWLPVHLGVSGGGRPAEPPRRPLLEHPEDVYEALKLGLKDYVEKNRFSRVLVAISGGIDSALVSVLAVDALGKDRVVGVTMPSTYTSDSTLGDAGELARNLDIEFHTLPIQDMVDAYIEHLSPMWAGRDTDTTEENIQARIRGHFIMALSNKFGWLVLATGNKSETATGYCTLYGDMVGGFSVIKDVPKTVVFELSAWRNERAKAPVIPPSTIARPPSAELRPDQRDSDSLPPYEILDPILEGYIENDMGVDAIVAAGFDEAVVRRVIRLVDANEYKRRQAAPGIKITPKAFGRDRRLPITNAYGRE